MIDEETSEIQRAAEAIADGGALDWEEADWERLGESVLARRLRLLAKVARGMRDVREEMGAEAPPPGPFPPSWGSLLLLEHVGRGSFGDVFRAHDPRLRRDVALKLIRLDASNPLAVERFFSEAQLLARVRHPNVMVVHGAEEHDGRLGLWTEFLHGQTLEQVLATQGPFGPGEAALIGMQLCRALAAIHAVGLIHGDIKASNVMRETGGRIVLMDFGAARDVAAVESAGAEVGTPLAMAPELLAGEPLGPAGDIYGIGALLYRLVSGHYPVEASSLEELGERHHTGSRAPLRDRRPDLPLRFIQVVERAIHSDPRRRQGSIGDLERELAEVGGEPVGGGSGPARPRDDRGAGGRVRGHAPRGRRGVIASWLIALAIVGVAAFAWWSGRRQPQHPGGAAASVARAAMAPLIAEASLQRETAREQERLNPGDHIAPGDRLFLLFRSPERAFVYVFDQDASGTAFALFPAADVTPENPLPPGRLHRLPGRLAGRAYDWTVTSSGGLETVWVVASRAPLPELGRELKTLPGVTPRRNVGPLTRAGGSSDLALRGVGEMTPSPGPAAGGRGLAGVLAALRAQPDSLRRPWIWEISLQNP